jgi:hypothetical protein
VDSWEPTDTLVKAIPPPRMKRIMATTKLQKMYFLAVAKRMNGIPGF